LTQHRPTCGDCIHFRNDAAHLERSFPGLTAMSSGRGSVRAADGLCSRHGLYLASFAYCNDIELKADFDAAPDALQPPEFVSRRMRLVTSIRQRFAMSGPR
jgi:hypothetical protein